MGNLHRQRRKQGQRGHRIAAQAWEAMDANRPKEAERLIRQALRECDHDWGLWTDLGLILWRRGDLRAAEKALRTALTLRPDHEDAQWALCELLATRGFYRQALPLAEELAAQHPEKRVYVERIEEYRRRSVRNPLSSG